MCSGEPGFVSLGVDLVRFDASWDALLVAVIETATDVLLPESWVEVQFEELPPFFFFFVRRVFPFVLFLVIVAKGRKA